MSFSSRLALALVLVCGTAVASQAHTTVYTAILSGPLSSPANASPGVGIATVTLDMDLVTLDVEVTFSGLQGTVVAAQIHAATPAPFTGTAIEAIPFTGFPTGGKSGNYTHNFDLTDAASYTAGYLVANDLHNIPSTIVSDSLNALDFAMDGGRAYVNIYTSAFPGGEIRGFLVPATAAPEPIPLLLMGLGGLALARRRRHTPA